MPLKPTEIKAVLDHFEEELAARTIAKNAQAGCVVCRRSDHKEVNRTILESVLNDGAVAKLYGVDRAVLVHHKFTCLVRYGGATFTTLQRFQKQRERLFPVQGKPHAQKLFFLNELLFIRDEALKKQPIDRKELARLAKEIDAAAAEYYKAKVAARKPRKQAADNFSGEFTAEQIEQMDMVKKKIAEGANGGPRQTSE